MNTPTKAGKERPREKKWPERYGQHLNYTGCTADSVPAFCPVLRLFARLSRRTFAIGTVRLRSYAA